jgi:hypothetical protein
MSDISHIIDNQAAFSRCLVALTRHHRFIETTRYLMTRYALKIGANFKIVVMGPDILSVINQLLEQYQNIILIDEKGCLNLTAPDLFTLCPMDNHSDPPDPPDHSDHVVVGFLETNPTIIESGIQYLQQTYQGQFHEIDPSVYLRKEIMVLSKDHQALFGKMTNILINPEHFQEEFNYLLQSNQISIRLATTIDPPYSLPSDLTKIKRVLSPQEIHQQWITSVDDPHSEHIPFYLQQVCDIYINRCYLRADIELDLNVVDSLQHEINRLKKQNKTQFRMLVFGMNSDCYLWSALTERRVIFVEFDSVKIQQFPDINPDYVVHVVHYSDPELTVANSFTWKQPKRIIPPFSLIERRLILLNQQEKFDLILINGPNGLTDDDPGRLLPIYWSCQLYSNPNTVIYLTNSQCLLERFCTERYLLAKNWKIISKFNDKMDTIKLSCH